MGLVSLFLRYHKKGSYRFADTLVSSCAPVPRRSQSCLKNGTLVGDSTVYVIGICKYFVITNCFVNIEDVVLSSCAENELAMGFFLMADAAAM